MRRLTEPSGQKYTLLSNQREFLKRLEGRLKLLLGSAGEQAGSTRRYLLKESGSEGTEGGLGRL